MYKKICVLSLMLLMTMMPFSYARADMWGSNFGAAGMKEMLEEIYDEIQKAIAAAAKMAAIEQATSSIESSLYGGDSSPRNIKNFDDFLVQGPQDKTVAYGEDWLTSTTGGKGGSSDYTSSSDGGDLGSSLQDAGDSVLDDWNGKNEMKADYDEYCSSTSELFADGNYLCFDAIMANPVNTPIGLKQEMDKAMVAKYQQEQDVAKLTATSPGTLPQYDDNGDVELPNSVVEEIQKQQVTLPLDALANGDSNVFSELIQSFAVELITNVINNGLSEAQDSMDKNNDAFQNQYDDEYGNASSSAGPEYDNYDDLMKAKNQKY